MDLAPRIRGLVDFFRGVWGTAWNAWGVQQCLCSLAIALVYVLTNVIKMGSGKIVQQIHLRIHIVTNIAL